MADERTGGRPSVSTVSSAPVSPVVVDPRMRSRRIAVRRDQGRRRLKRLTFALGMVAVVLALAVATRSPLLDVDGVDVAGIVHTQPGAVEHAAGIDLGDTMIGVDLGDAARRIEALPWIADARVSRRWPGTIDIQVSEREAVAVVAVSEHQRALVDADGRVLDIAPEPTPPLPQITEVTGRVAEGEDLGRAARDALAVLRAVDERLPGALASVSTELVGTLHQGGEVRFGDLDELEDKVVALETVLADVDTSCLGVLDVRVPGSPALTRHRRCS